MFGELEIGLSPRHIQESINKQLEKIDQSILDKAVCAAAAESDPDRKAVIAAQVLLNEVLPAVIALAIHKNNEKLVRAFEKTFETMRQISR